jgi:adenylylsulfate kinase-like enzyme
MKKKFKLNKKKGIVFWITGLSGSGKSTLAKNIQKNITNKYGASVLIDGDKLRNIFKLKGYFKKERYNIGISYSKISQLLSNNKVNVIIATVGLFHELHKYNRKTLTNYIEIFIQSKIQKLIKNKKKIFYKRKTQNIWGIDIKPEYPKNPHIKVINNFKKSKKDLSLDVYKRIVKLIGD